MDASPLLILTPRSTVSLLGAPIAFESRADVQARVAQLIWCTYRANIAPIAPTAIRTDAGWGCMLRAGQMLLANALVRHVGGSPRRVLALLDDSVDDLDRAPFAVQHIARAGQRYGTAIGHWFGPQVLCSALRDLLSGCAAPLCDSLAVYLARDGVVYRDELEAACEGRDSCLVLVPQRLGLNDVTPTYVEQVRRALDSPFSCGIAGGRSNGARFFCGLVDADTVLFLDPHVVQSSVPLLDAPDFDERSFHCDAPGAMPLRHIDPSLAFAFYCRDAAQRRALLTALGELAAGSEFAAITVVDELPDYLVDDERTSSARAQQSVSVDETEWEEL